MILDTIPLFYYKRCIHAHQEFTAAATHSQHAISPRFKLWAMRCRERRGHFYTLHTPSKRKGVSFVLRWTQQCLLTYKNRISEIVNMSKLKLVN
jgi:hypothetical protein